MNEPTLAELAAIIDGHPDWWRFPADGPVRGFLGTGPLFIVGDQPSTSPWESSHRHRREFYGLLTSLGVGNAHLTDLCKKRGSAGALRSGLPHDFAAHVAFFRQELAILRPTRVVALGDYADRLLRAHVPEIVPILTKMWHFGYAVRYQRIDEWPANARAALFGPIPTPPSHSVPRGSTLRPSRSSSADGTASRPATQREIMQRLFVEHGRDIERTIAAYAAAERSGEATRSRNASDQNPEQYARALLNDGLRKRWLR
ncbi:MAG: hypothetical protein ABSE70_02105 [Candidatus Limnocylindrales bacterium]